MSKIAVAAVVVVVGLYLAFVVLPGGDAPGPREVEKAAAPDRDGVAAEASPTKARPAKVGAAGDADDGPVVTFRKKLIKAGSGPPPEAGQKVTVHCTGYVTATGNKFWSTHDKGDPFSFTIGRGQVIKGWDQGVATMNVGETSQLTCSPEYAYGARGFPSWGIPPNAELMFEIELLSSVG